eukprot:CAMPEP_0195645360 /NCGR_PEP_ID=MMETSP0815-20121206/28897_1 /TAXON_ID=97485 /ORGANISM="Prymnesium parvum, Strain Texoma1" /LENGTH=38 /DNA_ID= /DNA_START= /DNA_END= /DNA_ORIENTATION=
MPSRVCTFVHKRNPRIPPRDEVRVRRKDVPKKEGAQVE